MSMACGRAGRTAICDRGVAWRSMITTIIPDRKDIAASREGRSKVLGNRKPASTLIVAGLADPAWKIEVEGVAVA